MTAARVLRQPVHKRFILRYQYKPTWVIFLNNYTYEFKNNKERQSASAAW